MTKIAVFTDLHANLPALESLPVDFQRQGCDEIIHLGDDVAIGPFLGEHLEIMHSLRATVSHARLVVCWPD